MKNNGTMRASSPTSGALTLVEDNVGQGLAPAFFIIYILWVLRTWDVEVRLCPDPFVALRHFPYKGNLTVPYKLAPTFHRENVGEGLCALPKKSNDVCQTILPPRKLGTSL